jgi:hypothetical protein
MQEVNFEVIQGDDFSATVQFRNSSTPINIGAWTDLKAQVHDIDGNLVGDFVIQVLTPNEGIVKLTLAGTITGSMIGAYLWDFQRTASGAVKTMMGGYINVGADVTALV